MFDLSFGVDVEFVDDFFLFFFVGWVFSGVAYCVDCFAVLEVVWLVFVPVFAFLDYGAGFF